MTIIVRVVSNTDKKYCNTFHNNFAILFDVGKFKTKVNSQDKVNI